MEKLLLFVGALFLFGMPNQAQGQSYSQNSVYFEALGNGIIYTVNYDRKFTDHFGARGGFMIISGRDEETNESAGIGIFPLMANYLAGSGNHRLELGAGLIVATIGANLEDHGRISEQGVGGPTTTFGYRYQPAGGGFLFRAGLTPFFSGGTPYLWGGLSLGYTF
ncbi:MAG: hypothetical protein ACQEST_02710 [Bacteroidota bacterium]